MKGFWFLSSRSGQSEEYVWCNSFDIIYKIACTACVHTNHWKDTQPITVLTLRYLLTRSKLHLNIKTDLTLNPLRWTKCDLLWEKGPLGIKFHFTIIAKNFNVGKINIYHFSVFYSTRKCRILASYWYAIFMFLLVAM